MRKITVSSVLGLTAFFTLAGAVSSELLVVGVEPAPRSLRAPRNGAIIIDFDRPVRAESIVLHESFWAFGRSSGTVEGTLSFSRGRRRVTLRPDRVFAAGESVMVILSRDVEAVGGERLRNGGYSYQFTTQVRRSPMRFAEVERHSTRSTPTVPVTSYGGVGTDLDHDRFLDLAILNNTSNDMRVFLNAGDRTGTFRPFIEPAFAAGETPSPSEASDFDRDGHVDVAAAGVDDTVAILLGRGDGTFAPTQVVEVRGQPRGLAVLDADGDGDVDIVSANRGSRDLALLENDGRGVFGPPIYFDGGGPGEWGLAAADMNEDGLLDLVVSDQRSGRVFVLAGNGDGTFTRISGRYAGGNALVVAVGDLDGDGHEDVTVVSAQQNRSAVLLGEGTGRLGPPALYPTPGEPFSTDLGDLDGDGDLDWVVTRFATGWTVLANDGRGHFEPVRDFPASRFASCALLIDIDNDRDLDVVLIDEGADEVVMVRNDPAGPPPRRP